MTIKEILNNEELKKEIIVNGWIRQIRKQSELIFMNINDGSNASGLQIVVEKNKNQEIFNLIQEELTNGCYLKCNGFLINSPAKEQKYELDLINIINYSKCPVDTYPLRKSVKIDTLRQMAHIRPRSKVFGAIFRIRNTLFYETHNFFQNNGFLLTDPNIITTNECEGGAGVFQVSEFTSSDRNKIPITKKGTIDYSKDHFKKQTFLTVSSQLQLEAMCCALGNVYTMNKSFRSEHSSTNKHMSEFSHLEIEIINDSIDVLMNIGENYLKHVIDIIYKKHEEDLIELNKFACKGIIERYKNLQNMKFYKIDYKDAIKIIQTKTNINVSYGEDLSSEMEKALTEYYKGFVFVINWPLSIKSFYMKQNKETEIEKDTCSSFDLLVPYDIGELIGGSMREEDLINLEKAMELKGVDKESLSWYLDLRKYGTAKHGGFGLGLERLLMLLTGMKNIKDVVPFPVYYQNCEY